MGQPVAGNPTQYMMEKAFASAGLDWRYLTFEVPPEKLADAMIGLRALGFKGGNFTIPHKVAVIAHLDELSPAAEAMQAVNCVNRVGDKLIGENTDGKGFLQSLRETGDPAGKQVVDPWCRRCRPGDCRGARAGRSGSHHDRQPYPSPRRRARRVIAQANQRPSRFRSSGAASMKSRQRPTS
jgi:hypothetical protein